MPIEKLMLSPLTRQICDVAWPAPCSLSTSPLDTRRARPTVRRGIEAKHSDRVALVIKWVASVIQIMGYTATGFGMVPLNLYFFLGGVLGWFVVGVLWKDRAIMMIHVVALCEMVAGKTSG